MTAAVIRAIFEYQISEDRRLWNEAIMPLPEGAFTLDTGYSWGTLQRECAHVVDVMHQSWQRVHGIKDTTVAINSEDPTREEIRAGWDIVEARWARYMAALDDRTVSREVDIIYRETAMRTPVWQTIFHFFNHNTLHRAEMRQMVAQLGGAAGADVSFSAHCIGSAGRSLQRRPSPRPSAPSINGS